MKFKLYFPPKSMWLPVGIIVLVLAIGYGLASRNATTGTWIAKGKTAIGLG
jgi:hypothetical protein